jgi:flagellum-specific peptidoglycan hydrolase FlgJ
MKKLLLIAFMFLGLNSYCQIDSTYYFNSKIIIDNYKKSRITPEDLYDIANEVNDSIGILVPYELALAQGLLETGLGSAGVGRTKNNPFSINSRKGYRVYSSVKDGIRAYYYLMARRYLSCRTQEQLLVKFVNCNRRRYASDVFYEKKLRKQINYFQRLIAKKNDD